MERPLTEIWWRTGRVRLLPYLRAMQPAELVFYSMWLVLPAAAFALVLGLTRSVLWAGLAVVSSWLVMLTVTLTMAALDGMHGLPPRGTCYHSASNQYRRERTLGGKAVDPPVVLAAPPPLQRRRQRLSRTFVQSDHVAPREHPGTGRRFGRRRRW